ncbi:MAG: hypothetical protein SF053_05740 [Bacteroidia bacterium]|nr:hypothetical protein [Bacteroidia bacterium]
MPVKHLDQFHLMAGLLASHVQQIVFTGSATLDLYPTHPAAAPPRTSAVLEAVVEARSMAEMLHWRDVLHKKGFSPDSESEGMVQMWRYDQVRLRLRPSQAGSMVINNPWFGEAVFHARWHVLSPDHKIRIFTPPFYLAVLLEQIKAHGNAPLRLSEAFEDLVYLVQYREELPAEILTAYYAVRNFIQTELTSLLKRPYLDEDLYLALPLGSSQQHITRLRQRIQQAIP